jgi:hypothetical protein
MLSGGLGLTNVPTPEDRSLAEQGNQATAWQICRRLQCLSASKPRLHPAAALGGWKAYLRRELEKWGDVLRTRGIWAGRAAKWAPGRVSVNRPVGELKAELEIRHFRSIARGMISSSVCCGNRLAAQLPDAVGPRSTRPRPAVAKVDNRLLGSASRWIGRDGRSPHQLRRAPAAAP